jgi:hypothetical protein
MDFVIVEGITFEATILEIFRSINEDGSLSILFGNHPIAFSGFYCLEFRIIGFISSS